MVSVAGALQVCFIEEESRVSAVLCDVFLNSNDMVSIGASSFAAAENSNLAQRIPQQYAAPGLLPCNGVI